MEQPNQSQLINRNIKREGKEGRRTEGKKRLRLQDQIDVVRLPKHAVPLDDALNATYASQDEAFFSKSFGKGGDGMVGGLPSMSSNEFTA
jgi:hypothetical protein